VILLPIAIGVAVLALLAILRRERHARESGLAIRRPLFVTLTLAVFAFLAAVYVTVFVVSSLTA
jgi:hypothetical protein